MKNLKINEQTVKNILKKNIALVSTVFTLVTLSGCVKDEKPKDWPSEFAYIEQENNNFSDFYKTVIRDGVPIVVYKGDAISLAVNKETYEVEEYIFFRNSIGGKIYDFSTGYMIIDFNIFYSSTFSKDNASIISDNNYIVDFVNISDYIEGEELKDYYSLEEIKELEPRIIESLKKINEYNSTYQKVRIK